MDQIRVQALDACQRLQAIFDRPADHVDRAFVDEYSGQVGMPALWTEALALIMLHAYHNFRLGADAERASRATGAHIELIDETPTHSLKCADTAAGNAAGVTSCADVARSAAQFTANRLQPSGRHPDDHTRALETLCHWVHMLKSGIPVGTLHHAHLMAAMVAVQTAFNLPYFGDEHGK